MEIETNNFNKTETKPITTSKRIDGRSSVDLQEICKYYYSI